MTDNTTDVTRTLDFLALLRQLNDRLVEVAGDEGRGGAKAKASAPVEVDDRLDRLERTVRHHAMVLGEVGALEGRVGNLERRLDALSADTPDSPLAMLVARVEALERAANAPTLRVPRFDEVTTRLDAVERDVQIVDRQLARRAGDGPTATRGEEGRYDV